MRCGRIHSGEEGTIEEYYAANEEFNEQSELVAKEIAVTLTDPWAEG